MTINVIDSSYLLSYLFPDEGSREVDEVFDQFFDQKLSLIAPTLLAYEVCNGLKSALVRNRITEAKGLELLNDFTNLAISLLPVDLTHTLHIAKKFQLSVYDAAYIVLAQSNTCELLTHDRQLKRAVSI